MKRCIFDVFLIRNLKEELLDLVMDFDILFVDRVVFFDIEYYNDKLFEEEDVIVGLFCKLFFVKFFISSIEKWSGSSMVIFRVGKNVVVVLRVFVLGIVSKYYRLDELVVNI